MQNLEEFKKAIMSKGFYREGIPQEVMQIIEKALIGLVNQYKIYHCDYLFIQEYAEGELKLLESQIMKQLGEERKDDLLEQVMILFNEIEMEKESDKQNLEETMVEEKNKNKILNIKIENQNFTERIMGLLEDSLKNVQFTQNRILSAQGYKDDRIETIFQNIKVFIMNFLKENQEKVNELLEKDTDFFKEKLLEEYEEYQYNNKKSKKSDFRDRIDGNLSLESQKNFSEEFKKREKEENNLMSLPDDLLK